MAEKTESETDLCCGHVTCQRLVREAKADAWDEAHEHCACKKLGIEHANPYV